MTNLPKPVPPTTINRLRLGVPLGYAMLAGMQLDLFTALKDGSRTAEQLAATLSLDAEKLGALLYGLVLAGLLTVADEQFANGPEAAEYLVKGQPNYMGSGQTLLSFLWDANRTTAESIRTGLAQSKVDWDTIPLDRLEAALRGLLPGAMEDGRALLSRFDFSGVQTVADVGGGSGGLALSITEARSGLRATVLDLPRITPISERIIREANATERVDVHIADAAREPLPGQYDAVVIRNVLQVLSAADAANVVRNAGNAVKPGGMLYIIGAILDDARTSPAPAVAVNLFFLNVYDDGQAYTEQQHRDWLAAAGFTDIKREPPPRVDIISARKPLHD